MKLQRYYIASGTDILKKYDIDGIVLDISSFHRNICSCGEVFTQDICPKCGKNIKKFERCGANYQINRQSKFEIETNPNTSSIMQCNIKNNIIPAKSKLDKDLIEINEYKQKLISFNWDGFKYSVSMGSVYLVNSALKYAMDHIDEFEDQLQYILLKIKNFQQYFEGYNLYTYNNFWGLMCNLNYNWLTDNKENVLLYKSILIILIFSFNLSKENPLNLKIKDKKEFEDYIINFFKLPKFLLPWVKCNNFSSFNPSVYMDGIDCSKYKANDMESFSDNLKDTVLSLLQHDILEINELKLICRILNENKDIEEYLKKYLLKYGMLYPHSCVRNFYRSLEIIKEKGLPVKSVLDPKVLACIRVDSKLKEKKYSQDRIEAILNSFDIDPETAVKLLDSKKPL